MNTGFGRESPKRTAPAPCTAFTADVWEEYALGMRSEEDSASLEEHLLICPVCQDLLADADEYVQAVKAAADLLAAQHGEGNPPVTDSRTRRRLSKRAAAAATLA